MKMYYTKKKPTDNRKFCIISSLLLLIFVIFIFYFAYITSKSQLLAPKLLYSEPHRPQFHFSVPENWMNDPNGLVYHDGTFHLFYQHHPNSTQWGPMHWGHATSNDLIHWKNEPIALSPNELGTIFSGCALVDERNVTGLQESSANKVLIAIFTQHLSTEEIPQLQRQSLAYSNDNGMHWTMYKGNPIIDNPDILDFRDPKIIAYKDHYIMALAAFDRIIFYKSYNLLNWTKLSEFGEKEGSHGGVWECPDLFPLSLNNETFWVLLVSINPGGPNNGSATQYFIGSFDGVNFVNRNSPETVLWIDFGPDNYAGITWFGTSPEMRLFIGWMNNWDYGNLVPTSPWRGQLTIPRTLSLQSVGRNIFLASTPVRTVKLLRDTKPIQILLNEIDVSVDNPYIISKPCDEQKYLFDMQFNFNIENLAPDSSIQLCLRNNLSESICLNYLLPINQYEIDRSKSGEIEFSNKYSLTARAPRLTNSKLMDVRLLVDVSSIEVFSDRGLTQLTSLFFAHKNFCEIDLRVHSLNKNSSFKLKTADVHTLSSIW